VAGSKTGCFQSLIDGGLREDLTAPKKQRMSAREAQIVLWKLLSRQCHAA